MDVPHREYIEVLIHLESTSQIESSFGHHTTTTTAVKVFDFGSHLHIAIECLSNNQPPTISTSEYIAPSFVVEKVHESLKDVSLLILDDCGLMVAVSDDCQDVSIRQKPLNSGVDYAIKVLCIVVLWSDV